LDEVLQRPVQPGDGHLRFRGLQFGGQRIDRPLAVVESDLRRTFLERLDRADAVLRVANLHSDAERFNFHGATIAARRDPVIRFSWTEWTQWTEPTKCFLVIVSPVAPRENAPARTLPCFGRCRWCRSGFASVPARRFPVACECAPGPSRPRN